jgi:hypothetical protein
MENDRDYRQFVFRMVEARQPEEKSWIQFRETLDTTILGTLSASVGVVVLIIGVSGVLRFSRAEWQGTMLMLGIAAIVGETLGVAGLTIGKVRNGAISPLAAFGTVACFILMDLLFGEFVLMHLQG